MSDINFLPDEAKDDSKEGKKIRRIELTPGKRSGKSKGGSEHGGVLSIFRRKEKDDDEVEMTAAPSKVNEKEPLVKGHGEKRKVQEKIVEVTEPEAPHKDENKKLSFFARLFSKKKKPILLVKEEPKEDEGEVPPPPSPEPTQYKEGQPTGSDDEAKHLERVILNSQEKKEASASHDDRVGQSQQDAMTNVSEDMKQMPPPEKQRPPLSSKQPRFESGPPPVRKGEVAPPGEKQKTPHADAHSSAFDVNLVPDELVTWKRSMNRMTLLALIAVLAIAGVGLLYGILLFYQNNVVSQAREIENQLADANQQIVALEPVQRDALVLQKRTQEIKNLLNSHIHWTALFSKLEKYTLRDVSIKSITADVDGGVTINCQATDAAAGFEQLDVFAAAEDFVEDALLVSGPTIPQTIQEVTTETDTGTSDTETGFGAPFLTPSTAQPGTQSISTFSIRLTLLPDLVYGSSLEIEQ